MKNSLIAGVLLTLVYCTVAATRSEEAKDNDEVRLILAHSNGLTFWDVPSSSSQSSSWSSPISKRNDILTCGCIVYDVDYVRLDDVGVVSDVSDSSANGYRSGYRLFWSDYKKREIWSADLVNDELSVRKTLVVKGDPGTIEGIAVDPVGQRLYWASANLGYVETSTLDGDERTPVAVGLHTPRAIAIDYIERLLFWSDVDPVHPRIEKSSLDGLTRSILIEVNPANGGGSINGLSLDRERKLVYWIDGKLGAILSISYDGGDRRTIISSSAGLNDQYVVAVGDRLPWIVFAEKDGSIHTDIKGVSLANNSAIQTLFHDNYHFFNALFLPRMESPRLPYPKNHCDSPERGGCSHICVLLSNNRTSCLCPYNYALSEDKKNCVFQPVSILVALEGPSARNKLNMILRLKSSHPSWPHSTPLKLPVEGHDPVVATDVDSSGGIPLWIDSKGEKISYYAKPNDGGGGESSPDLRTRSVPSKATAITVNPSTGSVFVASQEGSAELSGISECLLFFSAVTHDCTRIVHPSVAGTVKNIAVVLTSWDDLYLFWLYQTNQSEFVIEGLKTHVGTEIHVTSGSNLCCLTVDVVTQDLYWVDLERRVINRRSAASFLNTKQKSEYWNISLSLPLYVMDVTHLAVADRTLFLSASDNRSSDATSGSKAAAAASVYKLDLQDVADVRNIDEDQWEKIDVVNGGFVVTAMKAVVNPPPQPGSTSAAAWKSGNRTSGDNRHDHRQISLPYNVKCARSCENGGTCVVVVATAAASAAAETGGKLWKENTQQQQLKEICSCPLTHYGPHCENVVATAGNGVNEVTTLANKKEVGGSNGVRANTPPNTLVRHSIRCSTVCKNGGTCLRDDTLNLEMCLCTSNFTGKFCDTPMDYMIGCASGGGRWCSDNNLTMYLVVSVSFLLFALLSAYFIYQKCSHKDKLTIATIVDEKGRNPDLMRMAKLSLFPCSLCSSVRRCKKFSVNNNDDMDDQTILITNHQRFGSFASDTGV